MTTTGKDWRKGNPHILLMGMTNGAVILENNLAVPHAVKCIHGIMQQFHA